MVLAVDNQGKSALIELRNQDIGKRTTGFGPLDEGIPDFGPEVFDEIRKKIDILQTYGKVPRYETMEERKDWLNTLDVITDDVRNEGEMDSYFYPKGPVIAYGHDYRGYIRVSFEKGSNVEESIVDGIYEIFDRHARKKGVQEVPVVFMYESFPKVEARDGYWRPIIGGIQEQTIRDGVTYSATLGFAAVSSSGVEGYVISGHHGRTVGQDIYQPNTNSELYHAGQVWRVGGTYADASWVPYSNVEATIYIDDNDITGPIESFTDPVVGWYVYKSGIATGRTSGTVQGEVDEIGHPVFGTLYDQWYADYTSAGGDSGSPVYHINSNLQRELVGIHWGSTSTYRYFSPISGVQTDLDVTPLTR